MKTLLRDIVLLGALALTAALRAQNTAAASPPVPPPEAHQFDFWIGEWEVYGPQGNLAGHNKVEIVAGGFALLENWEAITGNTGKSLSSYKRTTKQWQQYYVGSGGRTTEYKGGLVDGKMVMVAEQPGPNGTASLIRGTWTPKADGTVLQQFETSPDGGKTWQPGFVGLYRRKK